MEGSELTQFDEACKYIRYIAAVLAVVLLFTGVSILGAIGCVIVAWWTHRRYKNKKQAYDLAQQTVQQLEERRKTGKELLRAILAEIVDFRQEFREKDAEDHIVLDFLQGLNPDQFIGQRKDGARRVAVQKG